MDETETMARIDARTARLAADGIGAEVSIARADATVTIRYVFANTGSRPLLVFDRGDTLAVATKRQRAGDAGLLVEHRDGGDLSLLHVPVAFGDPAPTVPPIALATGIAPGARHEGRLEYPLATAGTGVPLRLRYCVAVAGTDSLPAPPYHGDDVYRVVNAMGLARKLLCTPWFAAATATF